MKLSWLRYVYAQRLRRKLAAEGDCCSDGATLEREGELSMELTSLDFPMNNHCKLNHQMP